MKYKKMLIFIASLLVLAVISFQSPVKANEEIAREHASRGSELYSAGSYDGAIEEFLLAIDLGSEDYQVYYKLGQIYGLHKNNPLKARIYYEKYLILDPLGNLVEGNPYVEASFYVGNVYFDEENYTKAAGYYKKATDMRSPDTETMCRAHYKLGLCYIKLNNLDLAEKAFITTIQMCDSAENHLKSSNIIKACKEKSQKALEKYF